MGERDRSFTAMHSLALMAGLAGIGDDYATRYFESQFWAEGRLEEWRRNHPDDRRDDMELTLADDGPFAAELARANGEPS